MAGQYLDPRRKVGTPQPSDPLIPGTPPVASPPIRDTSTPTTGGGLLPGERGSVPTTGGGQRDTSTPTTGGGFLPGTPPIASPPQRDTSIPTTGGPYMPTPPVSAPGLEAPPRGMFPQPSDPFVPGTPPVASPPQRDTSIPTTGGGLIPDPSTRGQIPTTGGGQRDTSTPTAAAMTAEPAISTPPPPGMEGWVRVGDGWVPPNHPLAQQAGRGPDGVAPAAPGAQPQTLNSLYENALMKQLGINPQDVSAESAEIQPAIRARQLANQRAQERQLAQAAASGTTGGALESMRSGIRQQAAADDANFVGTQVSDLAKQRIGVLQSALAMAGGRLSEQERLAATKEIEGLRLKVMADEAAARNALGTRELDLRNKGLDIQGNLGLWGLLQGGNQFNQNLAAQLGMFGANQNNAFLNSLINAMG